LEAKINTLANKPRLAHKLGYGVRMATTSSNALAPQAPIDHPYILDSITETTSPMHPGETEWHRYVINQGGNQIVGYRRGNPQSVRVVQLNERRTIKPGRKHITIGPNSKKT